jgi:hypothetical protein
MTFKSLASWLWKITYADACNPQTYDC